MQAQPSTVEAIIRLLLFLGALGVLGTLVTGVWRWIVRPKLRLSVNHGRCRGDMQFESDHFNSGLSRTLYLRIFLENKGRGAAKNCRVTIERAWMNGKEMDDVQPSILQWMDLGHFEPSTIEAGHHAFVDLASFQFNWPNFMRILSEKAVKTQLFSEPGLYEFEIAARADWAITERQRFTLLHSGPDSVFIPTGKSSIYTPEWTRPFPLESVDKEPQAQPSISLISAAPGVQITNATISNNQINVGQLPDRKRDDS